MLYATLALAFVYLTAPVQGQLDGGISPPDPTEPCTVCYGGQTPIENPSFKFFSQPVDTNCTAIINEIAANDYLQGDQICGDTQLLAFQIGCCNSPPYLHCDVCADGSEFQRDLVVPIGQAGQRDPSCAENQYRRASINGVFEAGVCADTQIQRGGFYCGCPNEVQQCYICPDQTSVSNPQKSEAFVLGANCKGIEYYFSLFNEEECNGIKFNFGIDYSHFCECEGYEKEETGQCNLCSGGIRNPDQLWNNGSIKSTCADAQVFADSITRENVCLSQMQKAIDGGCECNSGGPIFLEETEDSGTMDSFAAIVPRVMIAGLLLEMFL